MRRTNRKTLWLCFLLAALFVLGTLPPASADTLGPAFDSYSPANGAILPGGWVTVNIRALDIDGIQSGSQQLLINGQAVPAVLNYDVKSVDPVTETTIYDFTHAVITYRKLYSDSINNVQFTVKDQAGNVSTLNWTFEVASAPVISNLTPAHDTATEDTTPVISATVTHTNGTAIAPASVVMTLDGVQVPAAYDAVTGLVTYTPVNPLNVGQTYTVSVSATDANNHTTSKQWNFNVVYPDMPVPGTKADCLRCHSTQPQSHRMGSCAACHDVALRKIYANQSPPPHFVAYSCSACHITKTHEDGAIAGQPAWYPIDAKYSCEQCHTHNIDTIAPRHQSTTTGDCSQCHSMVLEREHYRAGRTDKLGNPIDCFTCHTSTRPEVQQAIATNNTACEACHTAGHAASHTNPTYTALPKDPDMDCALCHNSDLATEHTTRTNAAGLNYTCDTCHKNSRPEVTSAIANKTKNCEACHIDPLTQQPQVHTSAGSPLHDTTYVLTKELACEQCHAGNIKTVHVGQPNKLDNNNLMTCATCHQSSNPAVQAAISAKVTKCDSCHTARHTNVNHTIPAGYVLSNPNNLNCADCHQSTSLTDLHVNKTTKTGVTMTCDTCHGSAAPANVKSAVTGSQANCDACHTVHPDDRTAHTNPAYTALAKDPDMDCALCHSSVISDEHLARKDAAGANYTCGTCHNSTRAEVKAAMLNNNKNCEACHIDPLNQQPQVHTTSGSPLHDTVFDVTKEVDCAQCHAGNVKDVHVGKPNKLANNALMTCDTCHQNASPIVQAAITGKDTKCSACHTTRHTAVTHTDPAGYVSSNPDNLDCSQCHNQALPDEHTGRVSSVSGLTLDCNTCHTSARAEVRAAISTGNAKCDACHTTGIHTDVTAKHLSPTDLSGTTNMVDCSWCHSNTLTDTHINPTVSLTKTMNCAACHGASAPVLNQVKLGQKACTDCHNGVSADTSHTGAQYIPKHTAVFPAFLPEYSPNCVSCHNDGTPGGTPTIDALHSSYIVGCSDCHTNQAYKPAVTSQNTDCTGCHDKSANPAINPAMDMTDTHKAFHNADTTRYPATAECLSCHARDTTADGQSLLGVHKKNPASTVTCDTCHGTAARQAAKDAVAAKNISCQACHSDISGGHNHNVAANGYAATPNADCTQCHATAANGTAELTAIHKDAADRGKIAGYSCTTCHNSTFAGTVIKSDGTLDMKQNGTTAIYCETCHDGTRADALGAKYPAHNGSHINATGYGSYKGTYNGQAFDDSAADCSKCHASLDTKVAHDPAVHTNVSCNSCHQSSNPAVRAVISGNWSRSATKAPYTCADCHNTLPYLHQPEHVANTADTSVDCSGCHSAADWTGTSAKLAGVHRNNCNTCHASSNSVVSSFITSRQGLSNPVYNCESCHTTNGAQTTAVKHQPEHQARHSATGMTCSSCHSFSVTASTAADIKAVHNNNCNTCHGSSVRADVKLVIASKAGQVNPVYNCEDCHGTIHAGWETKHQPVFPANEPAGNCANCHNNYLPTEHEKALTPSANTAIGYKVFRSTDNVNWTEIGTTTATSYANTGLTANTNYYYKVQAYDGKPNLSGLSNTVTVKTLTSTGTAATVNPDVARYASGNNGDSSANPSSTTDVLARLTDNSTSTYSDVRENGSSDQYVFITENSDANNYSKVELKLNVRYNNSTNLTIYPYTNSTSINTNTAYVVDGLYRSSSSNYITETIDVTTAANAMKGQGFMKFRIKPDPGKSASVYIANVQVILTQTPVSGGTATNPPGTLTPNSSDTSAPTDPSGLTGTANYYDRVDLTWTASTDTSGVTGDTCAVCHSAAARQQAKDAIAAKNTNCSACHAIHADITTAHTGPALPTTPSNCSGCHSNVLSMEHSANAKLAQNATLNCDTCHNSTLAKVKAAISSTVTDKSNLACTTCHTGTADGATAPHNDLAAPHLTGIFPTASDATCLNCHPTQAGEFAATKLSYHVVNGLTSKANTSYGGYLSPWTATSTVGCQGCHGNNNDGKAQAAKILKRPYTYTSNSSSTDMLCYLCHDRNTYGAGSDSTGRSGFASSGKNYHNISDHKPNNVLQCSQCHSSKPHATNKAHLIVTTSDPNSAGSVLTGYTHPASGQYSKSSCASSANSCNEH